MEFEKDNLLMMPAPRELIAEVYRLQDREVNWKELVYIYEQALDLFDIDACSEPKALDTYLRTIGRCKEILGI
jgi:hypothetical protein